ncbi:MAG: ZIP family metal transporter [Patescibacteria group bacterium]
MTEIAIYAIVSVIVVSAVSLIGIITLSLREHLLHQILFVLVGVAAGGMFGNAIINLIPESLAELPQPAAAPFAILLGILFFFVLEKFLHWKHVHSVEEGCIDPIHNEIITHRERPIRPMGYLVLYADAVHNFTDGIIIAASYLISIPVGIATTIAVILHEIPQEIGDFGLLIHSGFSKWHALGVNFISALAAVVGTLLGLFLGSSFSFLTPFIIAFAAGGFLYIAGTDLLPEIHKTADPRRSAIQFLAIIGGIGIMFLLLLV